MSLLLLFREGEVIPAAQGGGPGWARPRRLPKARPILTIFRPSGGVEVVGHGAGVAGYVVAPFGAVVVGGHAEGVTVGAVSAVAAPLEASGHAHIAQHHRMAADEPVLILYGTGRLATRWLIRPRRATISIGGHATGSEGQDWLRAAIAQEDEELVLMLTGELGV